MKKVIKIKKQCLICNNLFEVYKHREKTAKCCSKQCWYQYNTGERASFYGKHLSEKNKNNLIEINLGRHPSIDTIEKMRISAKSRKRLPCSESTKNKISVANSGQNNGQWKGGITPLRIMIWKSFQYIDWRLNIFKRDNFTCQMPDCDKTGMVLNAHHIKSFRKILKENNITTLKEALDCEELWEMNNGITLCGKCHQETKMHESEYSQLFTNIVNQNNNILNLIIDKQYANANR